MNGYLTPHKVAMLPEDPMAARVVVDLATVAYGDHGRDWVADLADPFAEPCRWCGKASGLWPYWNHCRVTVATDALIAVDMH